MKIMLELTQGEVEQMLLQRFGVRMDSTKPLRVADLRCYFYQDGTGSLDATLVDEALPVKEPPSAGEPPKVTQEDDIAF